VVELEHERVIKTAVNTRRAGEAPQDNANVAAVCCHAAACELQSASASAEFVVRQSRTRGVSLVAVGTQDLAFRHLLAEPPNGDPKVHHVADVGRLCARIPVIELEDNRIAFAAVDAWMFTEKLRDEDASSVPLERIVALIPLEVRSFIFPVVLSRHPFGAVATQ
jgi:hypothetical protein